MPLVVDGLVDHEACLQYIPAHVACTLRSHYFDMERTWVGRAVLQYLLARLVFHSYLVIRLVGKFRQILRYYYTSLSSVMAGVHHPLKFLLDGFIKCF